MRKVVYDLETYPNCFLFSGVREDGAGKFTLEVSSRKNETERILAVLGQCERYEIEMVGFNNLGFDYPILHSIMKSRVIEPWAIYRMAVAIIETQDSDRFRYYVKPSERFAPQIDLFKIHHFDNVARRTSLKTLEFNMGMKNIRDLPFKVGITLKSEQMDTLREYCEHDVEATREFLMKSEKKIIFREQMRKKYPGDIMNYSDVKIGKSIFQYELEQSGVQCYEYGEEGRKPKQTPRDSIPLKNCIPSYVKFNKKPFEAVRQAIAEKTITQTKDAFQLVTFTDGLTFHFGTGGIHASVEGRCFAANEQMGIYDIDVKSLYPSIAIENGLFPEHLGPKFVSVYRDLRTQRFGHPKGTTENDALKLALNGVYGESNSPFSIFYDPLFTMRITITGQLVLAMLVERLTDINGLQVIQVNTDGVTVYAPRTSKWLIDAVCAEWEATTRLQLEHDEFWMMSIADVNSYFVSKLDGTVKRKGRYEYERDWHQDMSAMVIPKVAEKFILEGGRIGTHLRNWSNPMDFMLRVKVNRGSKLIGVRDEEEIELENTQRYYVSTTGYELFKLMPPLPKNPGKVRRIAVEKGKKVWPCNSLVEGELLKFDYRWYEEEVEKLVLGVI